MSIRGRYRVSKGYATFMKANERELFNINLWFTYIHWDTNIPLLSMINITQN